MKSVRSMRIGTVSAKTSPLMEMRTLWVLTGATPRSQLVV
jgi:hypothetical protein